MKYTLLLTLVALLFFADRGLAQAPHGDSARLRHDSSAVTDTTKAGAGAAYKDDDGFDPAIFAVILLFVGVAIGAGMVGAVIAGVILGGLVVLVTAGILSAGVVVGLYRRSITAGFRTALLLACGLGGILVGGGGFYGVNRYFHLHFGTRTVMLAGAGGGLIGGLLLGLIVFALIRDLLKMLKQKLALQV